MTSQHNNAPHHTSNLLTNFAFHDLPDSLDVLLSAGDHHLRNSAATDIFITVGGTSFFVSACSGARRITIAVEQTSG
jgi:hypothetical protein